MCEPRETREWYDANREYQKPFIRKIIGILFIIWIISIPFVKGDYGKIAVFTYIIMGAALFYFWFERIVNIKTNDQDGRCGVFRGIRRYESVKDEIASLKRSGHSISESLENELKVYNEKATYLSQKIECELYDIHGIKSYPNIELISRKQFGDDTLFDELFNNCEPFSFNNSRRAENKYALIIEYYGEPTFERFYGCEFSDLKTGKWVDSRNGLRIKLYENYQGLHRMKFIVVAYGFYDNEDNENDAGFCFSVKNNIDCMYYEEI